MRRWRFAVWGGIMVGALALLAGALRGTEFRGGRPFPLPELGGLPAPSPRQTDSASAWFVDLLRIVLFLSLCLSVIVLFFSPRFRRHVFSLLVFFAAFLLVLNVVFRWAELHPPEAPAKEPALGGPLAGEGGEEAAAPAAPTWATYVAALAAGGLLAFWLSPRLLGVVAQRRRKKAIQEVAREAAAQLRQGGPVSDVVLRAWLRMVDILSARAGTADRPSFTPREFAENLAKLGFQHEAIQLLTELFEEVRYGHKESETRRAQALAALAALEQVYA